MKEPKTASSRRTIPLAPDAVAALRRHRTRTTAERLAAGPAYADTGVVFVDALGAPLHPDAVSHAFSRIVRAAGVPRITLHGLRHTFATLGLETGADVLDIAAILGHSSPAITQGIYQHTRPERTRAAVEAIAEAVRG